MRRLARQAAPHPETVQLLRAILSETPPRDTWERATMLRAWLAAHVRFLADPLDVALAAGGRAAVDDYLRDPVTEQYPQLRATGEIRGDCDDVALLAATLALAAGLPAVRFRVVSFAPPPSPFTHVYTEVRTSRGWLDADVTRTSWPGPAVTRTETVSV